MIETDNTKIVNTAILLVRCALAGDDVENRGCVHIAAVDVPALMRYGQRQQITGLLACGLDRAEIDKSDSDAGEKNRTVNWRLYKYQVAARVMRFDAERQEILREFEKRGIWYMPLKGIVMKDEYPVMGMRDMADNDILIDVTRRDDVRDVFIERGYRYDEEVYGHGHDDAYYKEPMYNFEMHNFMGEDDLDMSSLNEYYRDPSRLMVKDEDNEYGYHMKCEDFLIYLIAHAYKHFNYAGVGIRALIDVYVYMVNHADIDIDYIRREMEVMGIGLFGETVMSLSRKLFEISAESDYLLDTGLDVLSLNDTEQRMFQLMTSTGIYGDSELKQLLSLKRIEQGVGALDDIDINASVSSSSKFRYVMERLFPEKKALAESYEFCARHPNIYWLIHFRRFGSAVTVNIRRIIREITNLWKV